MATPEHSLTAAAPQAEALSLQSLLAAAVAALAGASSTPRLDAQLLLAFTARVARSTILAFPERSVTSAVAAQFQNAIARRAGGEPLAYITGSKEFFSITLDVTADVLVPRPETELIVDEMLLRFGAARAACTVLDLGTGSGALALAIKHELPAAQVWAADYSNAALAVARANGLRLGLAVQWLQSDWFGALDGLAFEAIVCNPPYVRSGDPALAGPLESEPRLALDGGSDGLDAYRVVLAGAPAHLNAGGLLLFEHGHDQQRAVLELAAAAGFETLATHKDLAGLDRMVVLRLRSAPR